MPSQRVDRFNDELAGIIGGARKPSLTFAPEAGTQRLRDVVNKGLTNADLLNGIKTAHEHGWDMVKLYFMIGLPTETDEDVLGIAETVGWLQRECRAQGRRRFEVHVTISNFTPKPHTPFQWHTVTATELRHKQNLLKTAFRRLKGVKINFTDIRVSALEDVLTRAGRDMSRAILRVWEMGVARHDPWFAPDAFFGLWDQVLSEFGYSWDVEGPPIDSPLPWDFIDTGIDKQWLVDDYAKALAEAIVPDCSFDSCSHCGICGEDFGANVVLAPRAVPQLHPPSGPQVQPQQRLRVVFAKRSEMRFIGHLDLQRLWERACRRAGLVLAYSNGFHPMPRISTATALALGMESDGEIVDFELAESVPVVDFRARLQVQLPHGVELCHVEEIPLKSPAAAQSLVAAEYRITLQAAQAIDWHSALETVLTSESLPVERTSKKSGKTHTLDCRSWLFELELLEVQETEATFRYAGACRNDGTVLRPDDLVQVFQAATAGEVSLGNVYRLGLRLTSLCE